MTDMVLASELEPGRYVCVSTKGILAWVIRQATKSAYNHVFIAGPAGQIVEATLKGVHVSSLAEYKGCLAAANLGDEMAPEQGMEIWSAALGMCGDLYNYADLLAIGFADIGWKWDLAFKVLGAGPWRICSQLAVLAGQKCVPPMNWLCKAGQPDEVTPAALARRPGVVPVAIT